MSKAKKLLVIICPSIAFLCCGTAFAIGIFRPELTNQFTQTCMAIMTIGSAINILMILKLF